MKIRHKYILRAIELGKNAAGAAAPNPMVGCCIVHNDIIIGEGFTSAYGGAHAEVNAINSVTDKALLPESALYVTLEPCSHFGNTPPCSDLIIRHQIPKVVIGLKDPHTKVAGKGIEKLKAAGISVEVGILEEACRAHHKRFLTYHEKKRPFIILKWAQSWDGFIAPTPDKRTASPEPFWITNTYSRQLVHQWRSREQAILIGTQTALADNPKLDVRHWKGKNPTRIVLDRSLKIPREYYVLDDTVKTIVLTEVDTQSNSDSLIFEVMDFEKELAHQVCKVLYRHHIASVIIEGGSKTLQTFIEANLWDAARIFKGQATLTSGIPAPKISGKIQSTTSLLGDSLTFLTYD